MPPRILVIRRRYLGDIVLLAPVFRNLRLHWPDAHIAAIAEAVYAPVLALNPDVDETIVLPRRAREWPGFVRRLRRARFTHVFDLDNNERTALLTRLTGAPFRATLWHEGPRPRWRNLYTAATHHPAQIHEHSSIADYYLAALAPANIPIVTREVRLVPRPEDIAAARQLLASITPASIASAKVLLHPGSRSPWRVWPSENFAVVADRIQNNFDAQVFLVGGPGEQALLAEIRDRAQTELALIDAPLSIPQFAALAAQFPVMLCHDSGPMHLAAAVGTRVVALLGSQNPVVFAPVGEDHTILQPPLPCTTCVAPGQCIPGDSYHNYCVRNITVDRVIAAVQTQLARA